MFRLTNFTPHGTSSGSYNTVDLTFQYVYREAKVLFMYRRGVLDKKSMLLVCVENNQTSLQIYKCFYLLAIEKSDLVSI